MTEPLTPERHNTDVSPTRTDPPAAPRQVLRWVVLPVLAVALAAMVWHGWRVREAAWEYFSPGRFRYDIGRNYMFGTLMLRDGLLNLYETQAADPPHSDRRLNYSPLRTVMFAVWARSNGEPAATPVDKDPRWKEDFHFNRVLIYFNIVLALLGAVAAGLLVLRWTGERAHPTNGPPVSLADGESRRWRAWPWVAAVIAFGLFWYNPGGFILAHGWPSPNAWVIPFFLWAVLFASYECWFVAGMTIGVGAMFQGQHLLVAPLFIAWPLMAGQPMRAARWAIGFVFAFALLLSGWMLTSRPDLTVATRAVNWPAVVWIVLGVGALVALPIVRRRAWLVDAEPARRRWLSIAIGAAVVCVLAWPALRVVRAEPALAVGVTLFAAAVALLSWWGGWRTIRYVIPAVVGTQLLLCMPLFGATSAWWEVGFLYGTERHPNMAVGFANNLGKLLETSFGFRSIRETVLTIPAESIGRWPAAPVELSMRVTLMLAYLATLLAAAAATAVQWRRGDRNFLLAVSVPWLLMALIPAQMHERYLGFAGMAAAVWIGARAGVGWALLGAFVSFVAYGQTFQCMALNQQNHRYFANLSRPFFDQDFLAIMRAVHPGISWALLMAAAVVLGAAFTRGRSRPMPVVAKHEPVPETDPLPQDFDAFSAPPTTADDAVDRPRPVEAV